MRETRKIIDVVVIVIFLALFGGYGILNIVKQKKSESKENRTLAEIPKFSFTKDYFQGLENYFNDRFLHRNRVIAEYSQFKINTFKSSPFPDKAKFGENGFLFMCDKESYDSYSNTNLLSDEKLSNVVDSFVTRKKRLKEKGIGYYFGYYPNKHSIYFENLPQVMKEQRVQQKSMAIQLKEGLQSKGFDFFDPKEALVNHKKDALLYLKLDSHWNNTGSYYAYVDFFNKYKELNVAPLSLDEFTKRMVHRKWGDLTRLLGVEQIDGYEEERPLYELINKAFAFERVDATGLPAKSIRTINNNTDNNRKVLFFGDSYSNYVINFYSLHFKEVIYIRDEYNEEMVNELQPDIVIQMSVERFLYKHF